MSVQAHEVQVGAIFITTLVPPRQLRKVIEITTDDQERTRVHYLSKSADIAKRPFDIIHSKSNPPLLKTFITRCHHLLSQAEIENFRQNNIILPNE